MHSTFLVRWGQITVATIFRSSGVDTTAIRNHNQRGGARPYRIRGLLNMLTRSLRAREEHEKLSYRHDSGRRHRERSCSRRDPCVGSGGPKIRIQFTMGSIALELRVLSKDRTNDARGRFAATEGLRCDFFRRSRVSSHSRSYFSLGASDPDSQTFSAIREPAPGTANARDRIAAARP